MYKRISDVIKRKSRSVANVVGKNKTVIDQNFEFVDNRSSSRRQKNNPITKNTAVNSNIAQRESIIDQIWAISQLNPGGFTRYTYGLNTPNNGYCVAYSDTQDCFGKAGLNRAFEHAQVHAQIIGGWLHGGNYYFDSVRVYKTRKAAVEAAIKENQIGMYDLSGQYIQIRTDDMRLLGNFEELLARINRNRERLGMSPFPVLS